MCVRARRPRPPSLFSPTITSAFYFFAPDGNHFHALVLAAAVSRACGLTLAIEKDGRLGHICSRLGCPDTDGKRSETDFLVEFIKGCGARCKLTRTTQCEFAHPGCMAKLNDASFQSAAIRDVLNTRGGRLNPDWAGIQPVCSDGAPPPSDFDVTVHFRAITDAFEGKHDPLNSVRFDDATGASSSRRPPFDELVEPLAAYITEQKWRRTVYLAANLGAARDELLARFHARNITACALATPGELLKHDPGHCDECLDVTFSEWRLLGSAKRLVAQMGMHCKSDCLDPADRKLGWGSSFSYTAATYAGVPTVKLDGGQIRSESLLPPNKCNPGASAISDPKGGNRGWAPITRRRPKEDPIKASKLCWEWNWGMGSAWT